jgi:hypothetical protein
MIADRRINAGLFLLALASLAVEVLLTRIFDVILWPNLAFVIISGAICGLALGGLVEIVAPDVTARTERLSRIALAFGLSVWTLPLFMNAVPFSLNRAAREPFAQLVWFLLLYLMLLVPFFCVGLCMCRILSGAPQRVQRLYFWDLTGAAIGAAIVIPLIRPLGPERLLRPSCDRSGAVDDLSAGLLAHVAVADRRTRPGRRGPDVSDGVLHGDAVPARHPRDRAQAARCGRVGLEHERPVRRLAAWRQR